MANVGDDEQAQLSDDLDEGSELNGMDEADFEEDEDGGAYVNLGDEDDGPADESEFYDNLAMHLPQKLLDDIALELLEKIDRDKKSREQRDKTTATGIKRTGLGGEAPGGAQFEGASRAVHPMITKACIEFQGRMMKEILPATGPTKIKILGRVTPKRWKRAERKRNYMNWQLMQQVQEFRSELEQTGVQSPLGGVAYMRWHWSERLRRPSTHSATSDKIILPSAATSFYSAERITYQDDITEFEYKERVQSGFYMEVDMVPPSMVPEQSQTQEALNKVEGVEKSSYNEDGVRRTFETNTFSDEIESALGKRGIKTQYSALPYLIYTDESSKKVLAIVRNWEQDDAKFERMHWIVEWPFVPWSGPYPVGFTQMIGSLSGAATGALRALLDSAHVNNFPTAARLKGAQIGGQSQQLQATQTTEINGGVGADDIRKLVLPVTYNPPSTVLYQLLQFLVDSGADMVRTTFENLSDQNPNMPVGTTHALIEQGLIVVSTIIGRMHYSMERTLQVLHRINRMYVTDDDIRSDTGELLAKRSDFQGPLDLIPVSDPGTPTEAHRTAKIQTIAARSEKFPQVYQVRNVEKMILTKLLSLSTEEADELLVPQPEPQEMNAANENAAASLGRPISAFPEQDHLAHLQTHLDYMMSPVFGMLPVIAPALLPAMLKHIAEHVALWYVSRVQERMQMAAEEYDITDYLKIKDPSVRRELDRTIAVVSQDIVDDDTKQLAKIPAIVQKAIQVAQQYAPQPMDPNAQAQHERNEITRENNQELNAIRRSQVEQKAQELGIKVVEGRQKIGADLQKEQIRQTAEDKRRQQQEFGESTRLEQEERGENQRTAANIQSKERINREDNMTALTIAQAEIESGERVAVEKGTSINPS